jgi:hypothetical protein
MGFNLWTFGKASSTRRSWSDWVRHHTGGPIEQAVRLVKPVKQVKTDRSRGVCLLAGEFFTKLNRGPEIARLTKCVRRIVRPADPRLTQNHRCERFAYPHILFRHRNPELRGALS